MSLSTASSSSVEDTELVQRGKKSEESNKKDKKDKKDKKEKKEKKAKEAGEKEQQSSSTSSAGPSSNGAAEEEKKMSLIEAFRLDENKSARRTCITMTAIMVIFPLVTFLIAYILLADQGSQRVIYSGAWGVGAVNVVMVAFVFYALCIDKDERPMDVWPSQMQGDNANKDKKER